MLKKFIFLFGLTLGLSLHAIEHPKKAFVSVAVADLMVDPYHKDSMKTSVEEYYHQLPFSGTWKACRRAHQLLFNEVVSVLEEKGPEVKVKISSFYFTKENESIPCDTYWTLKKNITLFSELQNNEIDLKTVPDPISYIEKNILSLSDQILTLKKPFYDPITKKMYSVGTRFVATQGQNLLGNFDQGVFDVYIYDSATHKMKVTQLPRANCIRNYSKKPADQIANFVQVLRLWCYQKEGAIPYVLGGWSWTITCLDNNYEINYQDDEQYAIVRKKWDLKEKTGFDCIGIIGRAAQVCDIPFYIKNTTTLIKDLESLKSQDSIEEGDLIWYPGHVMVVSSLKRNLAIEARGYERGGGKVQEVPLDNIFQEVKNYDELKAHYLQNKPITVLYANGKPWRNFKKFKILKMKSIWKKDPS